MKNNISRLLLTTFIAVTALPTMAQDYLKIYFKDGRTERHYMSLVDTIYATKYDLEGQLHNDYQMQKIVMKDITYSYYLSDIDSITFKKVEEEQLIRNIDTVENYVTPIFEQCSTVEEMEEHIDEIKNIGGVEDVWRSGSSIAVQIRDWNKVFFHFPVESEVGGSPIVNMARSLDVGNIKQQVPLKEDGTKIKVVIAFQMNGDPRFVEAKENLSHLADYFNQMGFDAHFIPDEETGEILDIDFFEKRMFEYDIVLILTHGFYMQGVHYFATSEKPGIGKLSKWALNHFKFDDIDDIDVESCHTGEGSSTGFFKTVSEKYIGKSDYRFNDLCPHIVFNGACESLNGDGVLMNGYGKNFKGDDAVAQMFFRKGADIYLGYNEEANYSCRAGYWFLRRLLLGYSEAEAYNRLLDNYKYEYDIKYKASLIDVVNRNSKYDNPRSIFLTHNQTVEKTQQEIDNDVVKNGKVKLEGMTYLFKNEYEKSEVKFGFRLGLAPHVEKLDEEHNIAAENVYEGNEDFQVVFSAEVNAEPGTKVYYRAFTFDGIYYNWGEERTFTITPLHLSTNTLSIDVGYTQNVKITSGSGSYKVEITKSSGENIITASVNENIISINALNVGSATITVTDTKTGQTATIEVTVTATCPANITSVLLDSVRYYRNDENPNRIFYHINAKLDDLTDVEEWGVYYDSDGSVGKNEFACNEVAEEKSFLMYHSGPNNWSSVDVNACVAELKDKVGAYVRKRDKTTGELVTLYSALYGYTLRYDKKPSLTIYDPLITETKVIETDGENKKYETTTSCTIAIEGSFWFDYIDSGISGGEWQLKTNDPWYPIKDDIMTREFIDTYSSNSTTLNHTTWYNLHLRNSKTITSNYINWSGQGTITNVWVSDAPSYARQAEPLRSQNRNETESTNTVTVPADMPTKILSIPAEIRMEIPRKGGVMGTCR